MYWIGGKPYISVTQVLKVIDKPAIRYWFGQQVYRAYTKEPSLSEQEALSAPYKMGKKAQSRGTSVHQIIENWHTQQMTLDPELTPYITAFDDFMHTHNVTLITHEQTVVNEKEGYAGTLDLIADIGGKNFFIDVKTSKDGNVYVEAGLQLSAYKLAHADDHEIAVVSLSEKGKYTFQVMPYDPEAFLACKKVYEYINRDMLLEV